MFKRILLPLDGSDMAEAVIPYGEELARKMGSELVLFHSCDDSHRKSHGMHRLYLEKRAELVRQSLSHEGAAQDFHVTTEHRFGDFIPSLCDYINDNSIDLIIMVAHGFTSPSMDSIVDDVVRLAKCPTLLVRRDSQSQESSDLIRKLLVPLDGTPYSQQILPISRQIAELLGAEIVLFSAVKPMGEPAEALEKQKKSLVSYLEGIANSLEGLKVSIKVAETSDFAVAIDEAACQQNVDMVTMVTNSRVTEWAESSIARKLLNKGATSLLVMHRQ
ncbi:universal stress protein [Dehalogenimonas sp. WBC-2]|nr:universal stress protein [Dehalogenimonas sp. WBC-2]